MEREKIRTLTKCFEIEIGQKRGGQRDLSEKRVFEVREKIFYQERSEKSI